MTKWKHHKFNKDNSVYGNQSKRRALYIPLFQLPKLNNNWKQSRAGILIIATDKSAGTGGHNVVWSKQPDIRSAKNSAGT